MGTAVQSSNIPNSNIPIPRKAEKKRVKLKMAVQGPSGSGKTWGALSLARNLWPDGKICVIDTENESASLYADAFDFDTIPLAPPFGTNRYLACINAAIKGGYDVLIIDSITPQWDGEGGILRRKEEMDRRPGSNGYANWASFTPEHEAFKQALQQSPIHVICTMRSKQDYILVANDKGKQVPKKVGMAPIQRDQMDYEFTLVFDVEMDHKGSASKDRTGLFNEKIVDLANAETAETIRGWLERGKDAGVKTTATNSDTAKPKPEASDVEADRVKWLDAVGPMSPEQFVSEVVNHITPEVSKTLVRCADNAVLSSIYNRLLDVAGFNAFLVPLMKVAHEIERKDFIMAVAKEAKRRGYRVNRTDGTYEEGAKQ